MDGKYRNWCFTSYKDPIINTDGVIYYIYQKEKCPSTKRDHWQGYIEFKNQKRRDEVKLVFNDNSLHVECRYGTQEQAINYCCKLESKIGEPVIYGNPKNQGHRSDLDTIAENIEDGWTAKEILKEHGGKALRVINMIIKGLEVTHDLCIVDKVIESNRLMKLRNASQVDGNTEPSTEAEIDNMVNYEKAVKYKKKMKKDNSL